MEKCLQDEQLLQFIYGNPGVIKWHNERLVTIVKLENNQLGIVLLPQNIPGSNDTLTIISKINPGCKFSPSGALETGVRITSIDGHDISKLQFEDVGKMIEDLKSKKQSLVFSVFSPILFEYSDRSGSFYGARRVDSMTPLSTDSDLNTISMQLCAQDILTDSLAAMNTQPVVSQSNDVAASSPVLDIASEVLKNPGLIKWNDKPQNVVVKKKTGEKIGLQYRVKQKASGEEYFLVEDVEKQSPCDGILFGGDWIRSVNGKPLVMTDNELFKQEVAMSEKEVKFVIQRPESIRAITPPRHMPFPTTALYRSRDADKIDVRSVYSVPLDTMSIASSRLSTSCKDRSQLHLGIPTGRKPHRYYNRRPQAEASQLSQTVGPSRRITEIDTVVAEAFESLSSDINEGIHLRNDDNTRVIQQDEMHIGMPDENLAQSIKAKCLACLQHLISDDIRHVPYVTVNVVSTGSSFPHDILLDVKKEFGILEESESETSQSYQISNDCLERLDESLSSEYTIEDVIIAKHLARNLKGSNHDTFIESVKAVLADGHRSIQNLPDKLLKRFIENPPALDADYLEIQFKAFHYEELLHLWPTVYFSEASVYVIIFDVDKLSANASEEIQKIQRCMNLIHTSSSKTKIYLLAKSMKSDTTLDTIISKFQNLSSQLKNQKQFCMECKCDREKLYSDSYSQVQQSTTTNHIAYWVTRSEDWTTFIKDMKSQFFSEFRGKQRFPFAAVMVMKIIKELHFDGTATATITRFKDSVMDKGVPDVSEETFTKILGALHICGKICCFSLVAHRTVYSSAHNQFILLKPEAIRECAIHITQKLSTAAPDSILTETYIQDNLMKGVQYKDHKELLIFLQLFHILEGTAQNGRYLCSWHYMRECEDLGALVSRMTRNNLCWTMYVDFHGLLPWTICLSLLQRLGEVMGHNTEIKSMCTGLFVYERMHFLVHLLPYQGRAVVFVSPEVQLPMEYLHQLLFSVLFSAVQTNLLTYHIGEPCIQCIEHSSIDKNKPIALAEVAHIKDYRVTQKAFPLMIPNVNVLSRGYKTPLKQIPDGIADVLIRGLAFQDVSTRSESWETLFRRLGYCDNKLFRLLQGSDNPAQAFYSLLKRETNHTLYSLLENLEGTSGSDIVMESLCHMGVLQSNACMSSV